MLDQAAKVLNYQFRDPALLAEALTHSSVADHRLRSNERMEFLGDSILGLVICEHLYQAYPHLLEGEMTKIKSAVVSRRVCAQISQDIDLAGMLNMGKGMMGRPSMPSSVAAAVLESIIAAIYLDGGIEPARKFILDHMVRYIEAADASSHQENFKSVLQQYAQRHLPHNPSYVLLDEKGPDHAKAFEVCVEIAGRRFTSAWANAKKEAEQKAALQALCDLGMAQIDDAGMIHLLDPDAAQHNHAPDSAEDLADAQID